MIKELILLFTLLYIIKPSIYEHLKNNICKYITLFLILNIIHRLLNSNEKFNNFRVKYPPGVQIDNNRKISDDFDYNHAIKLFEKRSKSLGQISASASEVNRWKCKNAISTINTEIDGGKGGYCPFYRIDNVQDVIKGKSIIMKDIENPCYKVEINPTCVANTIKDNDKTFLKLFPKFINKTDYMSTANDCRKKLTEISNIYCGTLDISEEENEKLNNRKCNVISKCNENKQ